MGEDLRENDLGAEGRGEAVAEDRDVLYARAEQCEAEGRVAEARQMYQELVGQGDIESMSSEAYYLRREGRFAEAESLMRRGSEGVGEASDYCAGCLGIWLWGERRDPAAEPLLRRGMEAFAEVRERLAELLLAQGREQEACDVLEIGIKKLEAESFGVYSDVLIARGDFDRAEELLRQCLEFDAGFAFYNLYEFLEARGRHQEARVYLLKAFDYGEEYAAKTLSVLTAGGSEADADFGWFSHD